MVISLSQSDSFKHLPSNLEPMARDRLRGQIEAFHCQTIVLSYQACADQNSNPKDNKVGGRPALACQWPVDKNKGRMLFCAQINFGELPDLPHCPGEGLLMLFLSPDYQSFRPKDQSWMRLVFQTEESIVDHGNEAEGKYLPASKLSPNKFSYVSREKQQALLLEWQEADRTLIGEWFNQCSSALEAALEDDHQQIMPPCDHASDEAVIMASFHANGITYDQVRAKDSHYQHLVREAKDWKVFWKLRGLPIPDKRTLFICIRNEDLINLDFGKATGVFL